MKIKIEGLEGNEKSYAEAFNALVDKVEALQPSASKEDVTALKTAIDELKSSMPKDNSTEFEALKTAVDELKNNSEKTVVPTSGKDAVIQGILKSFEASGVKTFADLKKKGSFDYEIKTDNEITTGALQDLTTRTQQVSEVRFPKLRPTAFYGKVRINTLEQDKSQLMWTVGAYTSNAGYAGEFSAIANGNAATATAKTRKLAKIGARQVVTEETFEDLSQFAARIYDKLIETTTLLVDTYVWSGDGDDSTNPTHIYGIKNKGVTAFDAVNAVKVEKPNIADLADAMATQIEVSQYAADTVWMSPRLANKLRRTKDTTGQYVVNQLVTGELVMGGLVVEKNTLFTDNELLVGAKSAIQLWIKRGLSVEVERVPSTDSWNYYMYMRGQCLVEDEDKKALVYCSDVVQALEDINIVS